VVTLLKTRLQRMTDIHSLPVEILLAVDLRGLCQDPIALDLWDGYQDLKVKALYFQEVDLGR
jgi:hypothetical protein